MRRALAAILLAAIAAIVAARLLHAQTANAQEMTSHDVQPTFKLQTERNLVMVRVIVRNSKGATVDSLTQDDFRLFDHGKPQAILHFSLEKPVLKPLPASAPAATPKPTPEAEEDEEESAKLDSTARRFVALYFDDVNTTFGDLARSRDAADHFLKNSIQPGDRLALYTSSGQKQIDFTDDVTKIHQALLELRERPIMGRLGETCGTLQPYEAYLIVEQHDAQALQVATQENLNCNPCPATTAAQEQECYSMAQSTAQSEAMNTLELSETQSVAALRGIEGLVRRMTSLPGQRSIVVISAGFLTETLLYQISQITDRALRAGVVINALDARGLYTDPAVPDASQASIIQGGAATPGVIGAKSLILHETAIAQTEGMRSLAIDTGGIFFNNSNDLEGGLRRAAGLPEAYYLLAFSPQNLKLDGAFHPIQVKLVSGKGLTLQARKGYYAPRKPVDPTEQEKEEIKEAVFSQEETHELPIDVHTQYFMKAEAEARMAVLTSLDVRPLRLRKEGDRNVDSLTFVTVVFDRDGHVVSSQEKTVELHLRDLTLERLQQTGITLRTSFDVKPGTYLVRAVVRDSESGQISGLNRTVEIPY